jgi:Fur family transcriptional regulator, ferric uptake regulator
MNNEAGRAGIKKQWINVIKKNQYKLTTQRKNIITFLAKEKYPRSADDIYIELKSEYPEIGIAKLYRTLDLLLNLKLISHLYIKLL